MKKLLVMLLAVALVFAFATTAFAGEVTLAYQEVHGGPSQKIATSLKDEPNSMDLDVGLIDFRGQSNFLFRGYYGNSTTPCTYLRQVTGTGYFMASYTANPYRVDMYASIASSSYSDYLWFSGRAVI